MYELPIVKKILSRLNEKRLRIQVVAGPRQVGKTTAVKQALKHYGRPFTYRLAEGPDIDPLSWLESEWQVARHQAKAPGQLYLVNAIDVLHDKWHTKFDDAGKELKSLLKIVPFSLASVARSMI